MFNITSLIKNHIVFRNMNASKNRGHMYAKVIYFRDVFLLCSVGSDKWIRNKYLGYK